MNSYIEIKDLNDPALAVYKDLNEIQLKRFYEPAEGLFIAESPKVIRRALDAGYEPVSMLTEPKYIESADRDLLERCAGPIYAAPADTLSEITGYHLTNGMLCAMRRKPLPSAKDFLAGICSAGNHVRIAVLEDIENPTNVGAIFRSAAAMGIDAVLLTDGCSDPLYRRSARVSVGTVFQIPWTWISETDQANLVFNNDSYTAALSENYPALLHRLGFKVASLALSDDSISIADPVLKAKNKLAILLGNEGNGLRKETIADSDYVVKIPMPEGIDSLNVAAASAVAFWELRK